MKKFFTNKFTTKKSSIASSEISFDKHYKTNPVAACMDAMNKIYFEKF